MNRNLLPHSSKDWEAQVKDTGICAELLAMSSCGEGAKRGQEGAEFIHLYELSLP